MTIGMLVIKFRFVFVFLVIVLTNAQRRIKDGSFVESARKYVVYILKAPVSPQKYDAWVCGGALVNPEFIITSAACVEDVQHLYAIAGYKKYIPYESLQLDSCTRDKKKKIVFICVPKGYDLVYERLEKWSNIDIALVRVESPYDLNDTSYEELCSYRPKPIKVNYDPKFQEPGLDTLTFGWGHAEVWRSPNDAENHNQEQLHYASAVIMHKSKCKAVYHKYLNMEAIIDKYMICTLEPGSLNDAGEIKLKKIPKKDRLDGCVTRIQRMKGMKGVPCYEPLREGENDENDEFDLSLDDETRRNGFNMNHNYRRNGICQNDHGGPLVTWVGSEELLIGVGSVFQVNNESKCVGPYLYTSTQCNGKFLKCILDNSFNNGRRTSCDGPPEVRGFDMIERQVSWIGHPDGPAENEMKQLPKHLLRTQKLPEQEPMEFSDPQFTELELPQKSVEQKSAERQLSETSIREQQFRTQELSDQQLSDQRLSQPTQLDEIIPGFNVPQPKLPELHLPDQESEEEEIGRSTFDYGQPSEDQFEPGF